MIKPTGGRQRVTALWARHEPKWLIGSLCLFMALAALLHFGTVVPYLEKAEAEEKVAVAQRLAVLASRLEKEVSATIFRANGLSAMLAAVDVPSESQIDKALKNLFDEGRFIKNIGLAPQNRISHVYPQQGNEAALGIYYPDVPSQWPAVKRAIDTRSTVAAGPVKLLQGGTGLISRTPVFLEDQSYWGIISLVVDIDALFDSVGLLPDMHGLKIAIKGKDGLGENGEVFFGDPLVFQESRVQQGITIADGAWVVGAIPIRGWGADHADYWFIEVMVLLMLAALSFLFYLYGHKRQQVLANEMRLRTFLNTTRDGVIVIDEKGIIQEFNVASEILFDYAADEVIGKSINSLMPAHDAQNHNGFVARAGNISARMMSSDRQVEGCRKDGTTFPIEVSVSHSIFQGKRFFIGLVRDIADQVTSQRLMLEMIQHDHLTGALNRRGFAVPARDIFNLAKRHHHPLVIMAIDADHFKKINDTFGHAVGDQVLRQLVAVTKEGLRATDHLARMGGEEFVALLPETDVESAGEVAERLLTAIRNLRVASDDGQGDVQFTVSIGLASIEEDDLSVENIMTRADKALYQAKSSGRDRYICFSSSENT